MKEDQDHTVKFLIRYFVLTFTLTWSIAALIILFSEQVTKVFGEISGSNPLFILAVYSPGIVAVLFVWKEKGKFGLKGFFRRLLLWRVSLGWWVFLIVIVPAVFYLGAALKGGQAESGLGISGALVPALVLAFFLGPIEEFGWRGYALPLMQRKLVPIWAGLLLGIIWAIWHIPAFLMSGAPQTGWSFSAFFLGVLALSIILTSLFNDSKGSLFFAYIYHFQMMNPLWPDAQPYDTWILLGVACVIVWFKRETMFSSKAAVKNIC